MKDNFKLFLGIAASSMKLDQIQVLMIIQVNLDVCIGIYTTLDQIKT